MNISAQVWLSNKPGSKILADAAVTVRDEAYGDLVIKKIRIMQGQDGEFVSLPQSKYEKEGVQKYAPIVWAGGGWKLAIDEAVLKAYSTALAEKVSQRRG